ncbi:MAG: PEP-CTERM sorting domain-containing protein [Spirulinaceae cyanobacterium SM2_1_0]|nr:PEP-CTERM sorting domain-containing protein [Spirulinaceae cyanobacterium SM2_1_0]
MDTEIGSLRIRPIAEIDHLPCYIEEDCIVHRPIPEPQSILGLMILGFGALTERWWRRKR